MKGYVIREINLSDLVSLRRRNGFPVGLWNALAIPRILVKAGACVAVGFFATGALGRIFCPQKIQGAPYALKLLPTIILLSCFGVGKILANYKLRRFREMEEKEGFVRCTECDYSLKDTSEANRCPECGSPIDQQESPIDL